MDFYGFHHGFLIESTPSEVGWIFIAFTIDSQLFSPRLSRADLHCRFSIIVTSPETE